MYATSEPRVLKHSGDPMMWGLAVIARRLSKIFDMMCKGIEARIRAARDPSLESLYDYSGLFNVEYDLNLEE